MAEIHICEPGRGLPPCPNGHIRLVCGGDFGPGPKEMELLAQGVGPLLQDVVTSADAACVNLEASFSPTGELLAKSGPHVLFDQRAFPFLHQWGFRYGTCANNHTMDGGVPGLQALLKACGQYGLTCVGAGNSMGEALQPCHVEEKGVTLSLLAVSEKEFGGAGHHSAGTALASDPSLPDLIADEARRVDCLVVFSHGGIEGVPLPPPGRVQSLRRFVEAGATLVIGHHPHVAQGWEAYRGGCIFYSLGDLCMPGQQEQSWGLLAVADFTGAGLQTVWLIPVGVQKRAKILSGVSAVDFSPIRMYLQAVAVLQSDAERYEKFWEICATKLWRERYFPWLTYLCTPPGGNVRSRLTRALKDLFPQLRTFRPDFELRDTRMFLNLLQNESHREALITGLEIVTRGAVSTEPDDAGVENELSRLTRIATGGDG